MDFLSCIPFPANRSLSIPPLLLEGAPKRVLPLCLGTIYHPILFRRLSSHNGQGMWGGGGGLFKAQSSGKKRLWGGNAVQRDFGGAGGVGVDSSQKPGGGDRC